VLSDAWQYFRRYPLAERLGLLAVTSDDYVIESTFGYERYLLRTSVGRGVHQMDILFVKSALHVSGIGYPDGLADISKAEHRIVCRSCRSDCSELRIVKYLNFVHDGLWQMLNK
jgi:hypothetical protein